MSDEQYRRLFRAGLAPFVDDVPKGPEWDEMTAEDIVTLVPPGKQTPRWLVGLAVSAVILLLVGMAVFLAPAGPPTTTGAADTVPPAIPEFDEDAAASEIEVWWSHVIADDFAAAGAVSHPDAMFNFGGLLEPVAGLGQDVGVSVEREVFGTDHQPMLCYTLAGSGGEATGAAVFRLHEEQWMLWEIRPGTVGCMDETTTTTAATSTTTPFTSEAWELVADHPVVGRGSPVVVWTGNEVVVWGGEKPPHQGAWHSDGAAWHPESGTWREVADSPLSARSSHVAVWTGSEIIVCCGRIESGGAAAGAYDPAADQWRVIASPPISPSLAEAVWTGEEMIVFGGVLHAFGAPLSDVFSYDPDTDTWTELAELPHPIERTADAVFADGFIYVWPSWRPFDLENPPGPLAYNVETDEWNPLPAPPAEAPPIASVVWTGRQLFAYGANHTDDGATGVGVLFDPNTGSWSVAESAPLDPTDWWEGTDGSEAAVWGDERVYIWTGYVGTEWDEPFTNVVTYDPNANAWEVLDPVPIPAQGLYQHPIIWTGTELITYSNPMVVFDP